MKNQLLFVFAMFSLVGVGGVVVASEECNSKKVVVVNMEVRIKPVWDQIQGKHTNTFSFRDMDSDFLNLYKNRWPSYNGTEPLCQLEITDPAQYKQGYDIYVKQFVQNNSDPNPFFLPQSAVLDENGELKKDPSLNIAKNKYIVLKFVQDSKDQSSNSSKSGSFFLKSIVYLNLVALLGIIVWLHKEGNLNFEGFQNLLRKVPFVK